MKQNQCFMASVVTSLAGYLLLHISIRVQNFKLYLTSLQRLPASRARTTSSGTARPLQKLWRSSFERAKGPLCTRHWNEVSSRSSNS